jgi:hypothetical protein
MKRHPEPSALLAQVNQELASRGCKLVLEPGEWVRYHLRGRPAFLPLRDVVRDYADSPTGSHSAACQIAHDVVTGTVQVLDTPEALAPSSPTLELNL